MYPSPKTFRKSLTRAKLGLFILLPLLSFMLVACTSSRSQLLHQPLAEKQVNFFDGKTSDTPLKKSDTAFKNADKGSPLQVCAKVPDEELQEMRGCYGIYYFTYVMDINLVDQPSAKVNYAAVVPEGSPAPSLKSATAYYSDEKVYFSAGPLTGGGLGSYLMVAGTGVTVNTMVQFNFEMPDASKLIPTINVRPQMSSTSFR